MHKISILGCLSAVVILAGCGDKTGETDYAAGVAAYELHDLAKAERSFNRCLEYNPSHANAAIYLARVSCDRGEFDAAAKRIEAARTLAGDASDVLLLDAQIAWQRKDYPRAIECYSVIAKDKSSSPELVAEALTGIGIVELTRNRRDHAHAAFLKALRIDRRNASLQYHLGLLYRDSYGYYEAAKERFEFFVRLSEVANPRVQKVQLRVLKDLKDLIAQAAAARPGASSRNSAACAAQITKAEEAWKKGAFKVARQRYQDALKADPTSYPAALGLAKSIAKSDTTKAGQDQCFNAYRNACSLNPLAAQTLLTTGSMAYRRSSYPVAVECYRRALVANPNSIEAADGLIRSLHRTGGQAAVAAEYQSYRDFLYRSIKSKAK